MGRIGMQGEVQNERKVTARRIGTQRGGREMQRTEVQEKQTRRIEKI